MIIRRSSFPKKKPLDGMNDIDDTDADWNIAQWLGGGFDQGTATSPRSSAFGWVFYHSLTSQPATPKSQGRRAPVPHRRFDVPTTPKADKLEPRECRSRSGPCFKRVESTCPTFPVQIRAKTGPSACIPSSSRERTAYIHRPPPAECGDTSSK
jgi:hypothetical protein